MNQSPFSFTNSVPSSIEVDREVAREFVRIGRLSQSGKTNEAVLAATALQKRYPNNATANFALAVALVENEQNGAALPYAEATVKISPNNARYLAFLGKLYVDLNLVELAPAVLDKAFALDKSLYQAPWALAQYYLEIGQGNRALPYYELALQALPENTDNSIRVSRAACLDSMGRLDEAEADYRWAMGIRKYRVWALARIALLKKHDQSSDYARQIRDELKNPDLTEADRSSLFLTLGRLYENGGDFDSAFLNFNMARKIIKLEEGAGNFPSKITGDVKVLSREVFERFRSFGHESDRPIFVVGMPRSGTTMTEQIIAAHSQAEGVGELGRMARLFSNLSSRSGGIQHMLDKMTEVGPKRWRDIPQQYLNLLDVMAPGARHTVDKMPHNFLCLGFIHLCFPNAKIIHCRRNPLDNFVSAFQNPMNSTHAYTYDQVAYGEYYINYLRLMDHWNEVLPGCIYESHYEALTQNPRDEVHKILSFLDLPWEESCLNFSERVNTVHTFSRQQVRNPINTASVSRWRNYEKHLQPIMEVFAMAGIRV
jgi:thioredoxin-like negative regulator of GroEL